MSSFPGRGPLPERVDIIILGGGANGVAIARKCAQAHKSVLLVERDDFACGTTSRCSRVVSGGLPFLQRGSLGALLEAQYGRAALLHLQPHLVQPLDFVLAAASTATCLSGLSLRAALWLYRRLGSPPSAPDVESLRLDLNPAERWTLSAYREARCDFPERLVTEWLRDACTAGAIARNHASVIAIRTVESRVRGVILRDHLTGDESYVESEWVINATGPWVDLVRDLTGLASRSPLARLTRSAYLMLRPWPGAPTSGVHAIGIPSMHISELQAPPAERSISIAPWNGMLQVGSTQFPHTGDPSLASPSTKELEFLLTSAAALFPSARLTSAAIAFSYTGIEPGNHPDDKRSAASPSDADSSHHFVHNHAEEGALGLLSVFGGTLATATALAWKTTHTMGLKLDRPPAQQLAFGPSRGIENTLHRWASAVHDSSGIPVESTEAIARWHGRHAMCVIQSAMRDPILATPIVDGRPQLVAQVVEAVAYERAITLADILLRRVPIALDQDWNEESTRQAATHIAPALYWNERRMKEEIQAFEEERGRFLHRPKNLNPAIVAA